MLLDFEVKSSLCPVPLWNVSPRGFREESAGSQEAETTMQPLPLPLNCVAVAKRCNFSDPPFALPLNAGRGIIPDLLFSYLSSSSALLWSRDVRL